MKGFGYKEVAWCYKMSQTRVQKVPYWPRTLFWALCSMLIGHMLILEVLQKKLVVNWLRVQSFITFNFETINFIMRWGRKELTLFVMVGKFTPPQSITDKLLTF